MKVSTLLFLSVTVITVSCNIFVGFVEFQLFIVNGCHESLVVTIEFQCSGYSPFFEIKERMQIRYMCEELWH